MQTIVALRASNKFTVHRFGSSTMSAPQLRSAIKTDFFHVFGFGICILINFLSSLAYSCLLMLGIAQGGIEVTNNESYLVSNDECTNLTVV